MNLTSFGLVLVIGLAFWGSWPLIGQSSKVSDPIVRGFLVNAVTAIGFLPFLPGRITKDAVFSSGGWLLILCGVLNFAGHALYPRLQTAAGSQLSFFGTMIAGLVVVMGAVGGPIFHGDSVTAPKVIFTLFIIVGVVGLAVISLK